jgi:hypothetical protein
MPDRQGVLVSAQFISPPSGIHEFRGLARFDGQVAVPFIRLKRRKKIAPSSWPDAKDHAPAFIGADRAIPNHLSEHIVGVVHDRLETRGSIVARRRKHNDQASLQEAALKAGGCQVIRAEKWSGTTTEGREALRTVDLQTLPQRRFKSSTIAGRRLSAAWHPTSTSRGRPDGASERQYGRLMVGA